MILDENKGFDRMPSVVNIEQKQSFLMITLTQKFGLLGVVYLSICFKFKLETVTGS